MIRRYRNSAYFGFLAWVATVMLVSLSSFPAMPNPYAGGLKDSLARDIAIGGALFASSPSGIPADLRNVAEREFNAVTAGVYMAYGAYPDPSRPAALGSFRSLVDWATVQGMRVHGHSLLYPAANEDLQWWRELPEHQVKPVLRDYVQQLAGSRSGKVWVWDVVNEALADDGEPMDSDGLRTRYKEYRALGTDYVEQVFHWAKASDPEALLILNEYGAEAHTPKADRLLKYTLKLRKRGVPIDGVGFQMHWLNAGSEPDYQSIEKNLQRFADHGFQIFITELDVASTISKDPKSKWPSHQELMLQKRIYEKIADLAMRQSACKALFLWEFADNYSWLHPANRDLGGVNTGEYSFPTPFYGGKNGEAIVAKPSYEGIREALMGWPR